jgi:VanZ family protein
VIRPRTLCRGLGGVGVVMIALVSLIPGDVQVRTPLPHDLEHFAAYMAVAGVLAMGFASPLAALAVAVLLSLEAGAMEVLQAWVPGRHTSLNTALISAAGAILGVMVGGLLQAVLFPDQPASI